MTQLLNFINTLWFKNHRKKIIKYSLNRERASNRLREDTAPGSYGERVLCSIRWTVRGTLLQIILDNCCLSRVVGWNFRRTSRFRNSRSSHTCSNAKKKFFLFLNTTESCFDTWDIFFYCTIHTRHVIKVSKLQTFFKMFFNITRYERES